MSNFKTSGNRHQSRIIAFQFLYGNVQPISEKHSGEYTFSEKDFTTFCESFQLLPDTFAYELVCGVGKKIPALDEVIAKFSEHWRIERMSKIDLTILSMGTYEIQTFLDIPKSVSINEAIELAKQYGEKDSPSFINGILDKIAKDS